MTEIHLKALLSSSQGWVYVAQLNGKVIGWLHCFKAYRLTSQVFYEIAGLVVDASEQRSGIGKKLVDNASSKHVGSWRVRCNNERTDAHQFYQNNSSSQLKTQRVFSK